MTTAVEARSATRSPSLGLASRAIRSDLPFLVLVIGFIAAGQILSRTVGYPRAVPSFNLVSSSILVRTAIYAVPALLAALCWTVVRHGRSLRHVGTWRDTVSSFFPPGRTVSFLVFLVLLPPFVATFTAFKISIPGLYPFSWDVRFADWDHLLHFGQHPWVLLQGILGHPAITAVVDSGYSLWFAVVWLTLIWQAWHGDYFSAAREQFLLAFVGCWIIIGVGFATLLSSAGPVYYGAVVGDPAPFGPLLEYLREVDASTPLKAIAIHEMLWQAHVDPSNHQIGNGISAMPSLHVSMAVLMTLLGFHVNRLVGWAYAAFALAIMIGSVHLAWHYAIDGYVAAVLTLAIWWASGRVTGAWEHRSARSGGEA